MIPPHVRKMLTAMRLEREAWNRAHPYRAFWRRLSWPTRRFYHEVIFRLDVLFNGHECEP